MSFIHVSRVRWALGWAVVVGALALTPAACGAPLSKQSANESVELLTHFDSSVVYVHDTTTKTTVDGVARPPETMRVIRQVVQGGTPGRQTLRLRDTIQAADAAVNGAWVEYSVSPSLNVALEAKGGGDPEFLELFASLHLGMTRRQYEQWPPRTVHAGSRWLGERTVDLPGLGVTTPSWRVTSMADGVVGLKMEARNKKASVVAEFEFDSKRKYLSKSHTVVQMQVGDTTVQSESDDSVQFVPASEYLAGEFDSPVAAQSAPAELDARAIAGNDRHFANIPVRIIPRRTSQPEGAWLITPLDFRRLDSRGCEPLFRTPCFVRAGAVQASEQVAVVACNGSWSTDGFEMHLLRMSDGASIWSVTTAVPMDALEIAHSGSTIRIFSADTQGRLFVRTLEMGESGSEAKLLSTESVAVPEESEAGDVYEMIASPDGERLALERDGRIDVVASSPPFATVVLPGRAWPAWLGADAMVSWDEDGGRIRIDAVPQPDSQASANSELASVAIEGSGFELWAGGGAENGRAVVCVQKPDAPEGSALSCSQFAVTRTAFRPLGPLPEGAEIGAVSADGTALVMLLGLGTTAFWVPADVERLPDVDHVALIASRVTLDSGEILTLDLSGRMIHWNPDGTPKHKRRWPVPPLQRSTLGDYQLARIDSNRVFVRVPGTSRVYLPESNEVVSSLASGPWDTARRVAASHSKGGPPNGAVWVQTADGAEVQRWVPDAEGNYRKTASRTLPDGREATVCHLSTTASANQVAVAWQASAETWIEVLDSAANVKTTIRDATCDVAMSADGTRLAARLKREETRIIDVNSQRVIAAMDLSTEPMSPGLRYLALSADGTQLAGVRDRTLLVFDVPSDEARPVAQHSVDTDARDVRFDGDCLEWLEPLRVWRASRHGLPAEAR